VDGEDGHVSREWEKGGMGERGKRQIIFLSPSRPFSNGAPIRGAAGGDSGETPPCEGEQRGPRAGERAATPRRLMLRLLALVLPALFLTACNGEPAPPPGAEAPPEAASADTTAQAAD